MSGARTRRLREFGLLSSVVVGVLLTLLGCGEEPKGPPELTGLSPAVASVNANEALTVAVRYEANGHQLAGFQWTAEAGEIEGNGQPGITYTAPATAGDYQLRVTVGYAGDDQAGLSLDGLVRVLSVDATEGVATAPGTEVAARTPGATEGAAAHIDRIRARGQLEAIVQVEFAPFSFHGEDGRRIGFDIDLARELARRWLDDPTAVRFVPVPTDARIASLLDGEGDVIIAALTDTPERRRQIDFSATYLMDGQRLLVPEASGVVDVCSLEGQKVAVIQASTSRANIERQAAACGFDISSDLVAFRRHADAVEALLRGEVAAFTSDGIALEGFAEGQPLKVVGNHFSEEPYGIGLAKGDEAFRHLVDATLAGMQADGTFAAIYQKWFGDTLEPYPLQVDAADEEVAALISSDAPAVIAPLTTTDPPETEYVVQPGDTLSKIAGKVWGDVSPAAWRRIYEANQAIIGDNPSLIEVGMTLTIPEPRAAAASP